MMVQERAQPQLARRSAARGAIWVMLDLVGMTLTTFLTFLVAASVLGPHAVGQAALTLSVAQIVQTFLESLFHDAIVQRPTVTQTHIVTSLTLALLFGCVAASGLAISAGGLAWLLDAPQISGMIGLAAIGCLFGSLNGVLTGVLRRAFRFRQLAIRSIVSKTIGSLACLTLLFMGYGPVALVAQYVVSIALMAIGAVLIVRPSYKFHVSFREAKELLQFGVLSSISNTLVQSNLRIFLVLVGVFMGTYAVGLLNLAFRIVDTGRTVFTSGLQQLMLPTLSSVASDGIERRRTFQDFSELTAAAVAPFFLGLAAISPTLVPLVLGAEWAPSAPLVQVLALGSVVFLAHAPASSMMVAMGKPGLLALQNLAALASAVILLFMTLPAGILGVSIAWVARSVVTFPLSVAVVRTISGISVTDQLVPWVPAIASATAMSLLVWGTLNYFSGFNQVLLLIAAILAGAAFYGIMMALISRPTLHKIRRLIIATMHRR